MKRRTITLIISVFLVIALYALLVILMNSFYVPPKIRELKWSDNAQNAGLHELNVLSWNLGYAGMGKESNFALDGGTDWRAPSKHIVQKNLEGITRVLSRKSPDIFLLQEVARPGFMNRGVDVLAPVVNTLDDYAFVYTPDTRTFFVPPPLSIQMGLAVFARQNLMIVSESRPLPLEPRRVGLRKHYQFLVNRVPIQGLKGQWVVINIHLAAFDEHANVRQQQLTILKDFAMQEFEKGNYVVIGGDWNVTLVDTHFSHTTDEKFLFWVHAMPEHTFPQDWQIVADDKIPSVRTVHKAYVPGENYVCVIDGFVTSPNVRAQSVATTDLAFEYSDHHPVEARFAIKEKL